MGKRGKTESEVGSMTQVDKRRTEIVMSSAELFIEKGYSKTTVRDIAKHCGISMGALYHYISSKEDILSLFQEITTSELEKAKESRLSIIYKMPPPEAIRYFIEEYLKFIDYIQDVIVFWYQEAKNLQPRQLELLLKQEEQIADVFEELLAKGCETGDLEIVNLKLVAHNIVVLCQMWAFRRWWLRKHYTLEQYAKAQIDFILAGISGASAR